MKARLAQTGWKTRLAAGLGAVLLLAAVFVGVEFLTAARVGAVTPAPGSVLNASDVKIVVPASRLGDGGSGLRVVLDGREVPPERLSIESDRLSTSARLGEGRHRVEVELRTRNLFARRLISASDFHVDTVPPTVDLLEPVAATALSEPSPTVRIKVNEPAEAVVLVDGSAMPLTTNGAEATGRLTLSEGRHALGLRVTDAAGNVTYREWQATADFSAPRITLEGWPGDTWTKADRELTLVTTDNMPDPLSSAGHYRRDRGSGAAHTGGNEDLRDDAGRDEDLATKPAGTSTTVASAAGQGSKGHQQSYVIATGKLPEGKHELTVTATDGGGHRVTESHRFLVDSADTLGNQDLADGAVGRDVRELQRALARKGFYKPKPTSVFDDDTRAAVVAFKKARGLDGPADVVDSATLGRLLGSIRIDRASCRLSLYDEGKLVKTYRVAVGQPQYPTPGGFARILVKEVNPTWNPPSSPWAIGQDPVPPGPGNPLGTRWMGLSIPAIGIHGTYADSSIGTHASHGCIRMHVWDAEDLFDRVFVGTPVTIS